MMANPCTSLAIEIHGIACPLRNRTPPKWHKWHRFRVRTHDDAWDGDDLEDLIIVIVAAIRAANEQLS